MTSTDPGATIELACSADTPYLPHVSAMLHSLLTHTTRRPARVWMMHGPNLEDGEGRRKLEQTVDDLGATIEFLRVPDEMMNGFPTQKFHYSCWYRTMLPELLPDVDRVLYLDCDIIVTDDLEPLWETDLGDKLFAACINPIYRPMLKPMRAMGIQDERDYMNSGVLLLDLVKLREERLSEHLREYAVEHPDNACPEQDAMSVLYRGRWFSLHPRWNMQTGTLDLPPQKLPFPDDEAREAVENPAVVHYNGPFKPWQYHCNHPMRDLYFEHLEDTPWPADRPEPPNLGYRLMRPLGVAGQYRVFLYLRPLWLAVRRAEQAVRRRLGSRA